MAAKQSSNGQDLHQTDPKKLATPATNFASSAEKHLDLSDPEQQRLYELYRPEYVTPHKRGYELMKTPELNKVCCFFDFLIKSYFLNYSVVPNCSHVNSDFMSSYE